MKFIIIPSTKMSTISDSILNRMVLIPRYSVDMTEVILHVEHYYTLFPQQNNVMLGDAEHKYSIYESTTPAFKELLDSEKWSKEDL